MDNEAIQKAHDDGFNSGLNWPDAWMNHGKPGGPFVTSAGYDEKSRAMHAQLSAENTAWCAGWEKGLAEKIATSRVNPLGDTDKNAMYHQTKI